MIAVGGSHSVRACAPHSSPPPLALPAAQLHAVSVRIPAKQRLSAPAAAAQPATMSPPAAADAAGPEAGRSDEERAVEALMERLSARKAEWAALPIPQKLDILREIRARVLDQPLSWARASAQDVKRDPSQDALAGELIATVATATSLIDGYIASLSALHTTGAFPIPPTRRSASGEQDVVQVFPWGWRQRRLDILGSSGVSAELYLKPGAEPSQGHAYAAGGGAGRVCVALGAGNQQFLALGDVLHQAFGENCVVALKYHPIQAPVAPFLDYVLEPLSRRGYCGTLLCGLPATQRLLYHPLADCACMTGGNATHDAIVWGPTPEEREQRKAADDPLLKVPMHSELGCVTPWLVAPGPWSEAELEHHARALAQAVLNNCSCNCLSAKVVLLPEGWEQGDALIAKFKAELAKYPLPNPYYPGIRERYAAFQKHYPSAEAVAAPPADPALPCGEPLPVLVNVLGEYPVDPQQEYAFQVEPFAPVVTFVKVPCRAEGGKPLAEAFLEEAVRAANEDLWGTLSCTMLVHPETEREHKGAVEAALEALRYGTVSLNTWSVIGYMVMPGHWGGFQGGQTLKDVGSGLGGVHNAYLYDHPQKQVVRSPFVGSIQPMPPHVQSLPLGVAKVVAGLAHSGLRGVLRMLLWAK